jgi:transcriptional regulator with XRE-family HTH domain
MNAGQRLRAAREKLGLTIRDVELASIRLAQKYNNEDFNIPLSRLSDIETKGVVPSIYRLYVLSVLYRVSVPELLEWYGIDLGNYGDDLRAVEPPRTHVFHANLGSTEIQVPVKLDPSFDVRRTTNIGRMVERWGVVPLAYLEHLANTSYTYGYIGTEDFTMYPLLMPGSFVQIDQARTKVCEGIWRSEYERPVYFVETRDGFTCCWCALQQNHLVLQPHPLSPVQPRILRDQQDAEIVGQVIGVAMRLGDRFSSPAPLRAGKVTRELN